MNETTTLPSRKKSASEAKTSTSACLKRGAGMAKKPGGSTKVTGLRGQAEARLRVTKRDVAAMPVKDVQQLVHELQVYQIELEMQNEELRRAQVELETARDHYVDLYDFSPAGHLTLDTHGTIMEANLRVGILLGINRKELIGRPLTRFIASDDQDIFHRHCQEVLKAGTRQTCEVHLRKKAGTSSCIYLESLAVHDEQGLITHWRTALLDITERIQAELVLGLSEARYRELIHALPAAVYITDEQGRIKLYNQAAVDLWGREPEVGKDLWCGSWKIYRPDGTPLPLDKCPMAVALREGRAIRSEEIVIERLDGTRRHVQPHPKPMYADGVVVGAINMLIDVSELHRAERDMAHLAAIVRSNEDAVISKNLQGIVMSWNGAAERLFGYTAEEMIGQPVVRLIPPDRLDEEPDILARIGRGESIENYETIRRRKDGTELHISLTVSPLIDLQGKIIGVSKIARNITEKKRVEETLRARDYTLTTVNDALKKQAVALAEANKELEGFSYSVSHDLRAPLRTIDAFSRILEEEHGPQLNDKARRNLGIVRNAVGQAGELIDDLLEFSKLGRQGMNFCLVEMADLAREAADDLRIMREGRQIDLTIGDLPSCQGDRRFLKLVWINLLANAFKFTKNRNESRIEVGWMPDAATAEAVIYYVKDNGIGFNMAYAHKLFGVFQRLHRKEDFDGTGVGLAVVQRIVQRHDGRVWAEGKVDGGATFFVSLRKAIA